jgi:hypothetical protein
MEKIINILKEYSQKVDLSKRFLYNFELTPEIFTNAEIEKLNEIENPFERNVLLKNVIHEKYERFLNMSIDSSDLDFWIINTWGGIGGFKRNQKNLEKINKFKIELNKNKLTKNTFYTISSLSKVASFLNPSKFVIYDSRVIYSLNWLILQIENKHNFEMPYFPMPSGRNNIIVNFDISTILNIYHLNKYVANENIYIKENIAYFKYCEFVSNAAKTIFGSEGMPYQIEMLLFSIADNEIFSEMKKVLKFQSI